VQHICYQSLRGAYQYACHNPNPSLSIYCTRVIAYRYKNQPPDPGSDPVPARTMSSAAINHGVHPLRARVIGYHDASQTSHVLGSMVSISVPMRTKPSAALVLSISTRPVPMPYAHVLSVITMQPGSDFHIWHLFPCCYISRSISPAIAHFVRQCVRLHTRLWQNATTTMDELTNAVEHFDEFQQSTNDD